MFKGKTPLLIAIVLGIAAGGVAWHAIRVRKEEVTRGWKLQDVIVAAADIQPGSFLSNDAVAVDKMPRKFVYDSVLAPSDMEVAPGPGGDRADQARASRSTGTSCRGCAPSSGSPRRCASGAAP